MGHGICVVKHVDQSCFLSENVYTLVTGNIDSRAVFKMPNNFRSELSIV